jgi:hypothetical protein
MDSIAKMIGDENGKDLEVRTAGAKSFTEDIFKN